MKTTIIILALALTGCAATRPVNIHERYHLTTEVKGVEPTDLLLETAPDAVTVTTTDAAGHVVTVHYHDTPDGWKPNAGESPLPYWIELHRKSVTLTEIGGAGKFTYNLVKQ